MKFREYLNEFWISDQFLDTIAWSSPIFEVPSIWCETFWTNCQYNAIRCLPIFSLLEYFFPGVLHVRKDVKLRRQGANQMKGWKCSPESDLEDKIESLVSNQSTVIIILFTLYGCPDFNAQMWSDCWMETIPKKKAKISQCFENIHWFSPIF